MVIFKRERRAKWTVPRDIMCVWHIQNTQDRRQTLKDTRVLTTGLPRLFRVPTPPRTGYRAPGWCRARSRGAPRGMLSAQTGKCRTRDKATRIRPGAAAGELAALVTVAQATPRRYARLAKPTAAEATGHAKASIKRKTAVGTANSARAALVEILVGIEITSDLVGDPGGHAGWHHAAVVDAVAPWRRAP